MGSKLDSLMWLKKHNLNTPDFRAIRDITGLDYFVNVCDMEGWEKISIRSDPGRHGKISWGLPFFPNRDRDEAKKILLEELYHPLFRGEINIIVAEGIDPNDSLISAKYFKDTREELVEYAGRGSTVRDIDRGIPKSISLNNKHKPKFPEDTPAFKKLMQAVHLIREKILPEMIKPEVVVELSAYKYMIGWMPSEIIFWEVI